LVRSASALPLLCKVAEMIAVTDDVPTHFSLIVQAIAATRSGITARGGVITLGGVVIGAFWANDGDCPPGSATASRTAAMATTFRRGDAMTKPPFISGMGPWRR